MRSFWVELGLTTELETFSLDIEATLGLMGLTTRAFKYYGPLKQDTEFLVKISVH